MSSTLSPHAHNQTSITGTGPIPVDNGVAFRVWAPHADSVSVLGDFNDWDAKSHPMKATTDLPTTLVCNFRPTPR